MTGEIAVPRTNHEDNNDALRKDQQLWRDLMVRRDALENDILVFRETITLCELWVEVDKLDTSLLEQNHGDDDGHESSQVQQTITTDADAVAVLKTALPVPMGTAFGNDGGLLETDEDGDGETIRGDDDCDEQGREEEEQQHEQDKEENGEGEAD